jgi:hypothetical protein
MSIDPNPYVPPKADVTDRDAPGRPSAAGRIIAYVDGLLALTHATSGLMTVLSENYRDSSAFGSNALLFGLASLGMWRRWRVRWWVQAVAILWAIASMAALG